MQKEEKKQNIIPLRYKFYWKLTRAIIEPLFHFGINYRHGKVVKLPEPCVILANHTTDFDPFLVANCIKNQMYFIASENCFRQGFKSKVLNHCYGMISKIKGASDTVAVMKSIRALREGKNVCVFPEGGRTFNGITMPVTVATGKFVKVSAAYMATVRIEGGYLKIPRWGFGMRKGRWRGDVVNVYSPEQLKEMTAEEVTQHISQDLYVNAYELQAKNPIRYKGKNLAKGLECAISVCPECNSIGTIKTDKNTVYCEKCGTKTTINDYAYFGEGFKFHTVTEWDLWQEEFYKKHVESFTDNQTKIICDENVFLRTFNQDHESTILGNGTFSLYKDRFSFTPDGKDPIDIYIENIPDSSVFSRSNFNFTDTDGIHYELYADRLINVRKYYSCWNILRAPYNEK